MGDVPKSLKHSGDGSPLVPLGSRGCSPRQKHLKGLEHKHTSLGELHLHGSGPATRSNRRFFCGPARYSTDDRHVTHLQEHLCVEPEAAARACRGFSSSNSGVAAQTGDTGLGLARRSEKRLAKPEASVAEIERAHTDAMMVYQLYNTAVWDLIGPTVSLQGTYQELDGAWT